MTEYMAELLFSAQKSCIFFNCQQVRKCGFRIYAQLEVSHLPHRYLALPESSLSAPVTPGGRLAILTDHAPVRGPSAPFTPSFGVSPGLPADTPGRPSDFECRGEAQPPTGPTHGGGGCTGISGPEAESICLAVQLSQCEMTEVDLVLEEEVGDDCQHHITGFDVSNLF